MEATFKAYYLAGKISIEMLSNLLDFSNEDIKAFKKQIEGSTAKS